MQRFIKYHLFYLLVLSLFACEGIKEPPNPAQPSIDKAMSYANNGNTPLTIEDYGLLDIDIVAVQLDEMNQLIASKSADKVDSMLKIQALFDYLNAPIITITVVDVFASAVLNFIISLDGTPTTPSLECQTTGLGSAEVGNDFNIKQQQFTLFNNRSESFSISTLDAGKVSSTILIITCHTPIGMRFANISATHTYASATIFPKPDDSLIVAQNIRLNSHIEHHIISLKDNTNALDISATIDNISLSLPLVFQSGSLAMVNAYKTQVIIGTTTFTFAWATQSIHADNPKITTTISTNHSYTPVQLNSLDATPILLASFTYPIDNNKTIGTLHLRLIAAIFDRNYANEHHRFVYFPVVSSNTGRVWLNNNLGADYANREHADFSPKTQAINYDDGLAYGSLFQWGRLANGHELDGNNWWDSNTASPSLWQGVNASYTVCPIGFQLATFAEFVAEFGERKDDDLEDANNSTLKLTTTGYRKSDGDLVKNDKGYYWTSDVSDDLTKAQRFYLSNTNANSGNHAKTNGYAVRCIIANLPVIRQLYRTLNYWV